MSQGTVTVNNLNLGQSRIDEVERTLLFIGTATSPANGVVVSLDTQTDFDSVFGVADSPLKTNIYTAMQNAGQNWQAYVITAATDGDHITALSTALETVSPEGVVSFAEVDETDIAAWQAKMLTLRATHGMFLFALLAARGIDTATETWAEYFADMESITDDLVANLCAVVPQLHGNDLGVLAGRLCDRNVSIADTPMRVETGPLISLGATPVDSDGEELPSATLSSLDAARYSVPQTYPGYPGVYWGDCNMLESPSGDYKVVEHLRIMLKAMRTIRVMSIYRIGNRLLNSTPASIKAHKTYFSRPLRQMSKSVTFFGYTFPGEIEPPTDDAVLIVWESNTHVKIYLTLKPYNCPKQITANLVLDLSEDA